jgi:hypothetical protein
MQSCDTHLRWRALALVLLAITAFPGTLIAQQPEADANTADDGEPSDYGHEIVRDPDAKKPLSPLKLGMFVDAYAAWQTSGKGTLATLSEHRAFTGQGATLLSENGLSLAFLGFDAEYDAGTFGVVANIRFGPGARIFHGDSDLAFGIDLLTQAYALYRPIPKVQLDAGMFISPFGYEALESWKNPNYTISALYTYGQPNWHMGFRGKWQIDESLSFTGMVINGINNISETQQRSGLDQLPQLGGTLSYEVSPLLSFAVSGLVALDQLTNDDEGYDAFGDFVVTVELDDFITALNVDYIFTRDGAPNGDNRHFIGFMLTSGYHFNDMFGIAARGEYLRDDASFDGQDVWHLWTGTLTFDVKPIPDKQYLIVRWENRWEHSNQRIFGKASRGTEDTKDDSYRHNWFETVLGVVVTTNP